MCWKKCIMLRFSLVVLLAVSVSCINHHRIAGPSHRSRTRSIAYGGSPSLHCGSHPHLSVIGAKCPLLGRYPKECIMGRCECNPGHVENTLGACTRQNPKKFRRSPDPYKLRSLGNRGKFYRARAPVLRGSLHRGSLRRGSLRRAPSLLHHKRSSLLPLRRHNLFPSFTSNKKFF